VLELYAGDVLVGSGECELSPGAGGQLTYAFRPGLLSWGALAESGGGSGNSGGGDGGARREECEDGGNRCGEIDLPSQPYQVCGGFGVRLVWRRGVGTECSSETTLFRIGLHTGFIDHSTLVYEARQSDMDVPTSHRGAGVREITALSCHMIFQPADAEAVLSEVEAEAAAAATDMYCVAPPVYPVGIETLSAAHVIPANDTLVQALGLCGARFLTTFRRFRNLSLAKCATACVRPRRSSHV
jgi:hypothetical protein